MKTRRISPIFLIFSLVICGLVCQALADGPAVLWQKTYGGSSDDWGSSVQQTADGGYIITGTTASFGAGSFDVYLIKTDSNGESQWQRTFGGSSCDWGYSVRQTSDDGYIIAGHTSSFGAGEEDVYLIKADPNGNPLWQKTFGGSDFDEGYSVQQTTDGGYIITGLTGPVGAVDWDVYFIKTDPNGNSQWQKTFGGSGNDIGNSVQQTTDGGYVITGETGSSGSGVEDVYLVKTDLAGDKIWQKAFGGSYYDTGCSVQQTSDGGYIITGLTFSFGAVGSDIYLIRTDPNGNSQWQKAFGRNYSDTGSSVQQTSDGGYIIAGYTQSFGEGDKDVYLIKLCSEDILLGDLNCDEYVDFGDFVILASQWLQEPSLPSADIAPDIRDNFVDFLDLATFVGYWLEETVP